MLWQTLFGFQGRIGRATLWLTGLAVLLIDLSILVLISGWVHSAFLANGAPHRPDGSVVGVGFALLWVTVVSVWIGLALKIKRCHDLGHSGLRLLIGLIPVAGAVWLTYELGFKPGDRRRNAYGEAPGTGAYGSPTAPPPAAEPEPAAPAPEPVVGSEPFADTAEPLSAGEPDPGLVHPAEVAEASPQVVRTAEAFGDEVESPNPSELTSEHTDQHEPHEPLDGSLAPDATEAPDEAVPERVAEDAPPPPQDLPLHRALRLDPAFRDRR